MDSPAHFRDEVKELCDYINDLRERIKAFESQRNRLTEAGILKVKLAEAERTLKAAKDFSLTTSLPTPRRRKIKRTIQRTMFDEI